MPVVVTGAAGFIGRHLVAALQQRGHTVVGIDRRDALPPQAHIGVVADLSDDRATISDVLRSADAVFHLAAFAGVREHGAQAQERRHRDNVAATRRVTSEVPLDVPLIVTSSSSIYGGSRGRACVETDAPLPRGGYAASKVQVERLCAKRVSRGGLVAVARPFTVAGEGQRSDMALARWIAAARAGRPLTVLGSGDRTRDITDVRDVVTGLLRMADVGVRSTINLGTGQAHTLRALCEAVAVVTGTDVNLRVEPAGSEEVPATLADTQRCARLLGFVPQTDLLALVQRQAAASLLVEELV